MERSAARARFVQWVDGDGSRAGIDGSPDAVQPLALVEVLGDDLGRLPARVRLRLPGCHAPTYAHAARLMAWLVDQGLSTWEDLPDGISTVPDLLLDVGNRLVDDELYALGDVDRDGSAEPR